MACSEACSDPGDPFCAEIDVSVLDPVAADFNAPPRLFSRADLRRLYHWDDGDVNFSMDLGLLPRPTGRFEKEAEVRGGKVIGMAEFWHEYDVRKFDGILARLAPRLTTRDI